MSYIFPSVMAGTILLLLAYVYFYFLYREQYMGIWIISWLMFFARMIIFDSGLIDWRSSILGFTVFQLFIIANGYIFLWGSKLFVNKPVGKLWLVTAVMAFLLTCIFALLKLPPIYKLFLPTWFSGIVLIRIGLSFVLELQTKALGSRLTGYSFILWGLLTMYMPYSLGISWLSPWCYFIAGITRLIITFGLLLVYFEKTRFDLITKEKQYRLLADNAVDVIYRYNIYPEESFEYISPSVLKITGYDPNEYYANPKLLAKLIHPDDLEQFYNYLDNTHTSDELPLTLRLVHKNQTIVWIEIKGIKLFDKNGKIIALEGILRDITTRKNMEQIVARAESINMVGQMAVNFAHEIRNPLTSVRGFLQLMKNKEDQPTKQERYELMIGELDRTNKIISEYLLLAKEKVPERKVCSLNQIITALLPLLQASAIEANVHIKLDLQDTSSLYLDQYEIRQLLINLVNNSLDAMQNYGGELIIRTFVEIDKVVLSITDRGSGIPPDILEHLGKPFLTTKSNRIGLGLPICYQIADRHQAEIRVETGRQGTTVFVHFDLLDPTA